ncbi:hypothetical protein B484DRAFT_407219 [Ochromonadaceae sp. CCMP2298]|nr:hypothetical protein B484DRAFT_407219 [Ochromonadaceae sp. CCMP2298]
MKRPATAKPGKAKARATAKAGKPAKPVKPGKPGMAEAPATAKPSKRPVSQPKASTSTPTDPSSTEYIFSLLRSAGELNKTSDRLSGGWGDLNSDSQGASSASSSRESADVPRTSQPAPLSASCSSIEPSLVVLFDVETTDLWPTGTITRSAESCR